MGEEHVRIEHWQVAADHAWHLAHHWMGERHARRALFLVRPVRQEDSDARTRAADDEVVRVSGSRRGNKWLALYSRDGVVTGILALSNRAGLALSKLLLETLTTLDDALTRTPWAARTRPQRVLESSRPARSTVSPSARDDSALLVEPGVATTPGDHRVSTSST